MIIVYLNGSREQEILFVAVLCQQTNFVVVYSMFSDIFPKCTELRVFNEFEDISEFQIIFIVARQDAPGGIQVNDITCQVTDKKKIVRFFENAPVPSFTM